MGLQRVGHDWVTELNWAWSRESSKKHSLVVKGTFVMRHASWDPSSWSLESQAPYLTIGSKPYHRKRHLIFKAWIHQDVYEHCECNSALSLGNFPRDIMLPSVLQFSLNFTFSDPLTSQSEMKIAAPGTGAQCSLRPPLGRSLESIMIVSLRQPFSKPWSRQPLLRDSRNTERW